MPLSIRPAALDDAPAIRDLLNVIDTIEIGRPETELHQVTADLRHPEADLARDSWLAHEDGELVGYGLLWDDSGAERVDIDHYVLPGRDTAAVRMFELMEARAAERARGNGAGRAVVHLHLNIDPTLDTAVILDRGWQRVRRYQVMAREVSEATCPPPVPPQGVTLRACTAEDDRRRAHELMERTFAEHFDHQPRTYEKWLADLDPERFDWSLVWIAAVEGLGDAGLLVSRNDREAQGWIGNVGVVKEARGRGLGGYLLRHAFAVFAGLGRDEVGLGVDTRNATGALRLYEAHGMTLHYSVDTWEVTLPV
ncbi:GNAT family N-acetyltransferase [Streptomyces sp. GMY02]|uniref:GNAT family N-acetyltransferase n=1 Tax=Streptomyces sp. GMY02 TaxID=1333528 RepID=UPI001C2BE5EE|nr:GNAT family N-acetyltransferase [Streptomyces sp. GMY02]QXE34892.1 GNAT family N-acetyltransferase [Streptomyces sp. GMY02]